jgi:ribulokinase
MTEPLFLGVDVGTQSLRAALFTSRGRAMAIASSPLQTSFPQPTWAEQHPDDWWHALCQAVPACLAQAGASADQVAALAIDATSCTVLAVDANGVPLRPALMWMDTRAHAQAQRVTASGAPVLRFAGRTVSPEFGIPKALWLREHEPQIYERAAVICECLDWLNFRLTGRWVACRNNASCKWSYIASEGSWPDNLLAQLDATDVGERWPAGGAEPLYPGTVIGPLTATAAAALGLCPGIRVVQGAIDAHAAAIGMNTLQPGQFGIILGTSSCHIAMSDTGVFGTGSWGPYPDALLPGLWTLEGGQTATGSIVRWVEQTAGGGRSLNELDAAAAAVGPGASGLLALDYWQGNHSPRQDPLARGVFVGLTLSHDAGHLLRAVYEATTFGARHILEDMVAHGFHPCEIVISGSGVQSRLWLQLHADICNLPVVLTAEPEATALGAVICAAVGAGAFADLRSAAAAMVQERVRIAPDVAACAQYDSLYCHYLAIYDALRPVMHALVSGT